MEYKERVFGEKITIDNKKTKLFFDGRTQKKLPHRYNYVIYQDDNPQLALERDEYEKNLIQKYLKLDCKSRVLDIGCGVGRWGDEVVKHINSKSQEGIYVGVDFSEQLLSVAQNHFSEHRNCKFVCAPFQRVKDALRENGCLYSYSHVFINGVLMYINDDDIENCLVAVNECCAQKGIVYIKEPVGVAERFTLNDFYSKELSSEYSAIYRSLKEYTVLFTKCFFSKGYSLLSCSPTWPDDLENRKETMNYYWILQK